MRWHAGTGLVVHKIVLVQVPGIKYLLVRMYDMIPPYKLQRWFARQIVLATRLIYTWVPGMYVIAAVALSLSSSLYFEVRRTSIVECPCLYDVYVDLSYHIFLLFFM